MMLAPIALFVYNRPWHTRQTIDALLKNDLASESDLFIFSDAAKNQDVLPAVQSVREYIRTVRGFKSVTIIEKNENEGLARSIIGGVSKLCSEYGQVIVMEDDLVSSPYFLKYMNDALDMYRDTQEVMHISGSAYPVAVNENVSSYFLRIPLCWGWATWDRSWAHFKKDIRVMDRFDSKMISRFTFDGTFRNYWEQLEKNRDGEINTWFIFWYATVFLSKGLVLFPKVSLLKNIGMDGTGVHCGTTTEFDVEVSSQAIELKPIELDESAEAFERHKQYFRSIQPKLYRRAIRKLIRIAKGIA